MGHGKDFMNVRRAELKNATILFFVELFSDPFFLEKILCQINMVSFSLYKLYCFIGILSRLTTYNEHETNTKRKNTIFAVKTYLLRFANIILFFYQ